MFAVDGKVEAGDKGETENTSLETLSVVREDQTQWRPQQWHLCSRAVKVPRDDVAVLAQGRRQTTKEMGGGKLS